MRLNCKRKTSKHEEFWKKVEQLKKQGIEIYRLECKNKNYLGEMITEFKMYLTKEDYIQALEREIKEIQTNILKWEGEIEKKKKEIEELKRSKE